MNSEKQSEFGEGGNLNVAALFGVLWRYKLAVLAVTAVCALASVWVAMTTPFVYRAEVVVTPVSPVDGNAANGLAGRLGGLASIAGISLPSGGTGQNSQAVLKSRYLTQRFIESRNLASVILAGAARAGSSWLAVDKFRANVMNIRQEKENGTTTVSIQWKNPEQAAEWANAYVALANEILRARALDESSRNIKFLNEQISRTQVVEIQRVLYGLVENETKNNMLASTREEYAFSVIDPAVVPEERVWPRRTLIVATGIALGGLLGGLLALVLNFWRVHRRVVLQ
jgi:uncharacterized protein involved in exopolysaccharide biosynthesis